MPEWLSRVAAHLTLEWHRSRLNWREAPKYSRHWRRCQHERPRSGMPWAREIAEKFWREGSASFLSFQLDEFLRAAFRCDYTIFYSKSYRVRSGPRREGSQLYHADGGPGTCIIVMQYETGVGVADGPLQVVGWKRSLEIFAKEPRNVSRDELCSYYESQVRSWDQTTYLGSQGTMIAFMNNTLHRGGYPHYGHFRDATVIHAYPSLRGDKTPRAKTDAYPRDPDI